MNVWIWSDNFYCICAGVTSGVCSHQCIISHKVQFRCIYQEHSYGFFYKLNLTGGTYCYKYFSMDPLQYSSLMESLIYNIQDVFELGIVKHIYVLNVCMQCAVIHWNVLNLIYIADILAGEQKRIQLHQFTV